MRWLLIGTMVTLMIVLAVGHAGAVDDWKVKSATGHVEPGITTIGEGKIGEGVDETAKGIGSGTSALPVGFLSEEQLTTWRR